MTGSWFLRRCLVHLEFYPQVTLKRLCPATLPLHQAVIPSRQRRKLSMNNGSKRARTYQTQRYIAWLKIIHPGGVVSNLCLKTASLVSETQPQKDSGSCLESLPHQSQLLHLHVGLQLSLEAVVHRISQASCLSLQSLRSQNENRKGNQRLTAGLFASHSDAGLT